MGGGDVFARLEWMMVMVMMGRPLPWLPLLLRPLLLLLLRGYWGWGDRRSSSRLAGWDREALDR